MNESLMIVHATTGHLREISSLFDDYRRSCGQKSDIDGVRAFLSERLKAGESEIFFARLDDQAVGFVQLCPLFSSVSMERIWILNDLFVAEASRRQGVGTVLLEVAAEFARGVGAGRLQIETAVENTAAQSAFESLGWAPDARYLRYTREL